jgi:CDP-diacylglycerol--serine O-phosphatidyltransferase
MNKMMGENQMNGDEKKKRRFFFRHGRRKRLEYIALLPSLVTLINGVCGFAAIGLAAKGPDHFAMAGVMIYIAMVADMLDGRLARMSHSTSSFGGQLDSLCDMLSFGAAPAFLSFKLLMGSLPIILSPSTELLGDFVERLIWLASAVYLCCAAVRLARFNVENTDDETSHMSFSGLPSPAAASVVASMVILYQHLTGDSAKSTLLFTAGRWIIIHALPFVMLWLAGLMVSRIRYPHVVNQYLRGKRPTTHLMWALVLGGMIWLCKLQMTMVVVSVGFAASGFVKWLWYHTLFGRLLGHKPAMTAAGVHTAHPESHL